MRPKYDSAIPGAARERIIKRYPNGKKEEVKLFLGRKLVGIRLYFESGELEHECPLKNGERHGIKYWWFESGVLESAQPFVDGLAHGVARQWHYDGRLIGTYRMAHGTGIDLWRQPRVSNGSIYLSEAMHYKAGKRHGFEWWLDENQKTVYIERHWQDDELHGIHREWENSRQLSRGYPKYFIRGIKTTKREYLKACGDDPTLPPFDAKDNAPDREFPPQVAKQLRP